jgi:REP element-mobilizing transposase RayT
MPRIARGLVNDQIYHVINRGNGRREVFHKDGDYESFCELMQAASRRYSIKVLAYCLMPNHYHMALKLGYEQMDAMADDEPCKKISQTLWNEWACMAGKI